MGLDGLSMRAGWERDGTRGSAWDAGGATREPRTLGFRGLGPWGSWEGETSSDVPRRLWESTRGGDATTSSYEDDAGWDDGVERHRAAVNELRRISGLTWEQVAQAFGVSRRSVHLWASGGAMTRDHQDRLWALLKVVRAADRGDASDNRAALLAVGSEGKSPLELLCAGDWSGARALLGVGVVRPSATRTPLSPAAQAERAPLPPEVLVGALQESVHKELGRARAARTARGARRGGE